MGEKTGISWCDHTFNPWWGCTRVSPACDHCYAETLAARFGVGWGNDADRRFFGDKHWNDPRRWNANAGKANVRRRVFCASMADVFEFHPNHDTNLLLNAARARLWDLIEDTQSLIWLLLTKRPHLILPFTPRHWWEGAFPPNVWVGTTVENEVWARQRVSQLLACPAPVRFLSCEPMRGRVRLTAIPLRGPNGMYLDALKGEIRTPVGETISTPNRIDWVIAGGESGPHARPTPPDWYRVLRDECMATGTPFFFKQWGEWRPEPDDGTAAASRHHATGEKFPHVWIDRDGETYQSGDESDTLLLRVGKKAAGAELDGREWKEFPR